MTPAHKTSAILLLAGLVAGGAALLSTASPMVTGTSAKLTDPSGLEIQARLQSSHIMLGTYETHLAVTVKAPTVDESRVRPPVNLAVVLDRSGSMSGEKLSHAKTAARQLVSQLRPTDRFSVVTYGSDVSVRFPSARATPQYKDAAYRAISAIYADGGTNLSGGLQMGHEQIIRNSESGAVERIVLISDGLANEGIVNRDELAQLAAQTAQRGVSITTVGVGLDFDEETMSNLAVRGRGNYYFAESSFRLAELFAEELHKLGATMATNVRLSLASMPGVEVLETYGYPMQREGRHVLIPIADLHSGESRKVVLRLRIDAGRAGPLKVADIGLSFRTPDSLKSRTVAVAATALVTNRENLVLEGRDAEALRHIERARTAKIINEATVQYESGNAQAARQLLIRHRQEARQLADDMGDAEFAEEIDSATEAADKDFAVAPARPASQAGKRARKANRKRAYDLFR